jgi:hypothetical protein
MSESDVQKTAELKKKIEREVGQLQRRLEAGTIDRKKLESGLGKICRIAMAMPPHKK